MCNSIKDITSGLFTGSSQLLSSGPITHGKNVHLVTGWHPKPNKSCRPPLRREINGKPPRRELPATPAATRPAAVTVKVTRRGALREGSALVIFHHGRPRPSKRPQPKAPHLKEIDAWWESAEEASLAACMGKKSIYLFRLEFNYYLARGGKKNEGRWRKKKVKLSFLSLTFLIRPNVSWHFVIVPSAVSFYFQLNI